MISVVIPAHDEAAVVGRCLDAMLAGACPGEIEIVVVPNGCHDETAAIARSFGPPVRVEETDRASKSHALNLGDQAARGFPRFYVDADVVLPLESIRSVAAVLDRGEALAAAPRIQADVSGASWPVRAYYDIWTRLPYTTQGMIGSGVYALSEEGRRRFDRFPEIISDDGFVHSLFLPGERVVVKDCHFNITAPPTLRGLLDIKTRSQKGRYQLRRLQPESSITDKRDYRPAVAEIARSPRLWLSLGVYALVMAAVKLNALAKLRRGALDWERDEGSRSSPV